MSCRVRLLAKECRDVELRGWEVALVWVCRGISLVRMVMQMHNCLKVRVSLLGMLRKVYLTMIVSDWLVRGLVLAWSVLYMDRRVCNDCAIGEQV